MKRIIIAVVTAGLLYGCSMMGSTSFQKWNGQDTFEGKGGAYSTEAGIDLYTSGAPPRKFKLLGYAEHKLISSSRFNAVFGDSMAKSSLVEEVKKQGGDAAVLVGSQNEMLGYSLESTYGGAAATSTTSNKRIVAVVKYLD